MRVRTSSGDSFTREIVEAAREGRSKPARNIERWHALSELVSGDASFGDAGKSRKRRSAQSRLLATLAQFPAELGHRVPSQIGPSEPVAIPPADVLKLRNGLEMRGIHARAVPAQMVNLKAFGDRLNQRLVCEPVGCHPPLQRRVIHPVAVRAETACPVPASAFDAYLNLRPESLGKLVECEFSHRFETLVRVLAPVKRCNARCR
jgi:hypothetical protein